LKSSSSDTILFIYNSFKDPLFQNLVLSYVKTLSKHEYGNFHLITFEQKTFKTTKSEKNELKRQLQQYHIHWHPLNYHTGQFLLLKKVWDFIQAIFLTCYIRLRWRTQVIFAFANVSGAICIVLKKILRMKMIIYSYEPHSEFMVELGIWSEHSLKYKLLRYLDGLIGREAEYILTGTKHMVDYLGHTKSKGKIFRAPTAVDSTIYRFREKGRYNVRNQMNISDRDVFVYVGKFGDLYYNEEIPEILSIIGREIPNAFFIVATPNDYDEIINMFSKFLKESQYHVSVGVSQDVVIDFLSAADFAINAIPPTPSQKFRSPTKTAEYLLCGLPYITCGGISQDDEVATEYDVGVVIEEFKPDFILKSMDEIKKFLKTDRDELRNRCRKVGMEYRSKERIDRILSEIYTELV